ncbi:MAG: hypothetical protein IPM07_27275 [Anaerolineales bacterium]|nr:hypothetical protein [Anaerolineales bacterium]
MTQLILVGGFLGAGKTTLLLTAARRLTARGLKVGLVTNDQGDDLVDTALAQQQRLAVTEVAGGCFCCRFPDLLKGLETLQRTVEPDVILAEPVGSCTDLLATVVRPLRHYHAGRFRIAPLTILIDPLRNHSRFAAEVDYLFSAAACRGRGGRLGQTGFAGGGGKSQGGAGAGAASWCSAGFCAFGDNGGGRRCLAGFRLDIDQCSRAHARHRLQRLCRR